MWQLTLKIFVFSFAWILADLNKLKVICLVVYFILQYITYITIVHVHCTGYINFLFRQVNLQTYLSPVTKFQKMFFVLLMMIIDVVSLSATV